VVAIRTSYGLTDNIFPDAWPRQGHPTSGFHRMSKSVKGTEGQAGANEDDQQIDDAAHL
jgi:hypothetical protein